MNIGYKRCKNIEIKHMKILFYDTRYMIIAVWKFNHSHVVFNLGMKVRIQTHSANSQHWVDPCISRDTWPHILYTWPPAWPIPTTDPHTRSSMWGSWLTIPQSCEVSSMRWGRSAPAGSSCTHAFSGDWKFG